MKKGLVKNADLKEETLQKFGSVENLLKYLIDNQFEEELCFSHGDTSLYKGRYRIKTFNKSDKRIS